MRRRRFVGNGIRAGAARFVLVMFAVSCGAPPVAPGVTEVNLNSEVRIGSETSGPEYQFTNLSFVVPYGDNVYVVQRGVPEIRVFGTDGRFRRTIGRKGAGPGEFETIWAMGIVGDSLWTIDINLRRLSFFDTAGTLVSTVLFDPVPQTLGSGLLFLPYPEILMREGDFLGFGRGAGSSIDNGDITANPLMRMTAEGRAADTLGWVSIRNDALIFRSARSRSFRDQPFSDTPLTVFAPAVRRAYVIERWSATDGNSASVRVIAIGAGGDTAWQREIPYAPARLEPTIVDSVRGGFEKSLASRYPPEEIRRALYAPAYRAPVTAAVAGDNGALWIRWDHLTKANSFAVMNANGDLVVLVNAPARVRLKWVSDSVAWGEELDDNDVPSLVRYRISPALSARKKEAAR